MALTKSENERLTQVEGEAPMGQWLRREHWIPFAISGKLVADGAPLRVRLLGEDFVAFRATDGRVGLFDERCPHRGASLALARNEHNALRCIYHGWQFGVDGRTLDVPTQAGDKEAFCRDVPLRHYPVREGGGIAWVWLGEQGRKGATPPAFPDFEFMHIPPENRAVFKQTGHFNWVQAVETTMDSAHAGVLHQSHVAGMTLAHLAEDLAPVYEIENRPYGFRYAGIRTLPEGKRYVRVNAFVLPWYGVIAPRTSPYEGGNVFFAVPIDNEHSTYWTVRYKMDGPIEQDPMIAFTDPDDWPPKVPGTPANNWGQDRALMKQGHFTGFPQHLTTEDLVIAESQGPILDRTREYLNTGDAALVRLRRLLLEAVAVFHGASDTRQTAASPAKVDYPALRGVAGMLEPGADWRKLRDY